MADVAESQENAPAERAELTVPEMRQWLRNWVGKAVGKAPDSIDESVPMVELGLSSRDAVAMAADIEDLTGVTLSVAVAFAHPTIESLATRIIEGEPETDLAGDDAEDWSRTGPAERVDIAIVGLSTRFPGEMNTPEQTWQALLEGRDGITDLPDGRWSEFLEEPRLAARVAGARTRGGYLKDIKGFDSEFFAVAKTEADNIDPQQRMALELTWEALEHARIPASSLRGQAVGVYIGSSTNDYSFLAVSDPTVAHPYAITGTSSSIIANRVSYFYDFHGPSVTIDTACSSSLVAIHQGVQALRNGEADVVVAGGVNALITPMVTLGFDEIGAVLAPDGRIKSFSADADGYTRSEGGGMLVLKRVDDARRDGDAILAVIAGSAVNHDGRSNGLIAPNQDAQADVLRRAYKDAGIDPRTVDYIEAHGTGTILGDPIEAEALGRVVGRGRPADRPALLGAVKTNVGHLESAAGAASMAKVVLALQHDKLPPSINFAGPSPYIDFDAMRLKMITTPTDWPRYGGYALAGVSSFGFGGANAHVVVREVLPRDVVEKEPEPEPEPKAAAEPAEAPTLAGHALRFDEFGNIITDSAVAEEPEPELPGVTEEALRLKEAALEERRVLAEVRASCLNSDGLSDGLTAPSGDAQTRLLRRAIAQAAVVPADVGMVEGHGTATRLGDRTELRSLAASYGTAPAGRGPLLGSVKSNIGHAQAAAGGLGLVKVILAAQHAAIPPTLHVDEPSREIDWEKQGLRLADKLTPWRAVDGWRTAAVSAFGMSGTNSHVIVSMPDTVSAPERGPECGEV